MVRTMENRKTPASQNPELAELGTHASAATELHKGRTTSSVHTIDEPAVANPGPYDTRTGLYEDDIIGDK